VRLTRNGVAHRKVRHDNQRARVFRAATSPGQHGQLLKRAHIYELLAASFSFKSYAALGVDTVFTQRRSDDKRTGSHRDFVRRRCIELGYPPEGADLVSVSLGSFLAERQIGVVQIAALISQLRGIGPA
jgi:hypothetical protein